MGSREQGERKNKRKENIRIEVEKMTWKWIQTLWDGERYRGDPIPIPFHRGDPRDEEGDEGDDDEMKMNVWVRDG